MATLRTSYEWHRSFLRPGPTSPAHTGRPGEYRSPVNTMEQLESRRLLAGDIGGSAPLDDPDDQEKEATYLPFDSGGYAGGSWHGPVQEGFDGSCGFAGGSWLASGDDARSHTAYTGRSLLSAGHYASGGYPGGSWPKGGHAGYAWAEGSIEWPTDVDMYSFDVSDGWTLQITANWLSVHASPHLRLFNDKGVELASRAWGAGASLDSGAPGTAGSRGTSSLVYQFADGGRYFLGVSGFGNDAYDAIEGTDDKPGAIGDYLLTLQTMQGPREAGKLFSDGIRVEQQPPESIAIAPLQLDSRTHERNYYLAVARSTRVNHDSAGVELSALDRVVAALENLAEHRGVDELWLRLLEEPVD